MRVFDLPAADVRGLVESVRGPTAAHLVPDAFARMAWTLLLEPGDQAAGRLLAGVGARRALELLIAHDLEPAIAVWLEDGVDRAGAERIVSAAFDRWRPRLAARPVVRAIERAAGLGLLVALPGDDGWPAGFAALGPAEPVALWARGESSRLGALERAIAIVGARASTGYGEHVAREIANGIAERGITVVSGGAYGIDAAAHRAALAAEGTTVAFLAGGLDRYYPAGNADLLDRLARTGLAIAEVPPGATPTKVRFLSRNRLLAAASAATVVVEAGIRSGSLNTANHALAIGRPVGAVPGPVTSPTSAGCHRLLREENAMCVTCADDAIELAGGDRADEPIAYDPVDPDVLRVLDALGVRRGRTTDEIARSSGMAVGETLGVLASLEISGVVRGIESGWVRVPGSVAPARGASERGVPPDGGRQ